MAAGIVLDHDRLAGYWKQEISPEGNVRKVWKREKIVPRIPEHFLDCSIFLYRSLEQARSGDYSGGSGFLVHIPCIGHDRMVHLYAVTNKHVIDNGFQVLRLNTTDGKTETITTSPQDWHLHPEGDDVAVLPIDPQNRKLKWFSVGTDEFVSPEIISTYRLGVGDEVFLIGRLVTLEGQQRNTPVVRFGNLSMMADANEPIKCSGVGTQESFLVECRSLSGFSGSPVFLTTTQYYRGESAETVQQAQIRKIKGRSTSSSSGVVVRNVSMNGTFGPWLLGIDWGHIPLWRPVYEKDRETKTKYQVEAITGIACVAPSWKILEVLNDPELIEQRKKDEREIEERRKNAAIYDLKADFTKMDFKE